MKSPKNSLKTESDTSPIKRLRLTFNSLDSTNSGFIDKDVLNQAIMYTGDNYDKDIIRREI